MGRTTGSNSAGAKGDKALFGAGEVRLFYFFLYLRKNTLQNNKRVYNTILKGDASDEKNDSNGSIAS